MLELVRSGEAEADPEALLPDGRRFPRRAAFGRYMSPAMVDRVAGDPSALKLGGEKREMTLLFCDVRGFTTISEMFDAEGLTRLINRFLSPMTENILANKGTIDKYMGDAIMAFWNAPIDDPDHGANACRAALAMNHRLVSLNQELEAEAKAENRRHVPIKIGIGLNSGPAVVGKGLAQIATGIRQTFDRGDLTDRIVDQRHASRMVSRSESST